MSQIESNPSEGEKPEVLDTSKKDIDHIEHGKEDHYESEEISRLSDDHKQYLIARHGTYQLDPLPAHDDNDPYNWPQWKKSINLALVAFHAMMGTFTAAAIQCAFVEIAEDLGVSVQRASYLTSLVIAILGGAPLFWRPLCNRFGRRPIFLISLICSLIGNIGCARSPSYGTMGLCRAITAFFISPAAAIGSATVAEMFFKKDRGRYLGIWTVMVTIGVPVAPFIFGFVAQRVGYRWIYWVLVCVNAVQFLLYLLFGQETLYLRDGTGNNNTSNKGLFSFGRIDPTPLKFYDFVQPLTYAARPSVMIPAAAYAMIFLWGSIMITIELPQLFPEKFGLDTQAVGLNFLSVIIGSLIGEQIGGLLSDQWMSRRKNKLGGATPAPEYRLWLSYIGHVLTIVGVVVFTVQTSNIESWNVTPVVGAAIAAAGNQIVTTINITYAIDCYRPDAASVGVFITFVRQVWGFIGPFWFPQMFEKLGFTKAIGVEVALMVGVSIIPTIILQFQGAKWH